MLNAPAFRLTLYHPGTIRGTVYQLGGAKLTLELEPTHQGWIGKAAGLPATPLASCPWELMKTVACNLDPECVMIQPATENPWALGYGLVTGHSGQPVLLITRNAKIMLRQTVHCGPKGWRVCGAPSCAQFHASPHEAAREYYGWVSALFQRAVCVPGPASN